MRSGFLSPQFTLRDRIGSCSIFVLVFALSSVALAARAQTVGPITPNPSAKPQQAPPQGTTRVPDHDSKEGLAGTWKLNRDQSDDPRQKLEQASSGGSGGWGQGPVGGGGGGWGGWGGPWGGVGGGRNRGASQFPDDGAVDMSDFSQLTIEQSDSAAKVTGADGRVLAQYSANTGRDKTSQDAKKRSKDNANTTAHWQGDELVTTTTGWRGTKITRTYELAPNGKQLYVSTRLDNPRFNQPVNIRFVYDPARSSAN
jgi:hypothetical protein